MRRETAAINVGRGHHRPERARVCILTSEVAAATAAHYAKYRPRLDENLPPRDRVRGLAWCGAPSADSGPAGSPETADARETAGYVLWLALCQARDDGTEVTDLMRITGWTRTKLYRHRRQYAGAGRAIGVSGGHWPARRPGGRSV